MQHTDVYMVILFVVAKHIQLTNGSIGYNSLRAELLHQQILLLHSFCLFVAHLSSELLHLLHELPAYLMRITSDNLLSRTNVFVVLLCRHALLTDTATLLNMVFEANLVLAFLHPLRCHRCVTGADRIELMNQFEHRISCIGKTVWSKIFRTSFVHLTSFEYARIRLARDTYIWITLAVFKQNVVVRLILLDKVVLQQECVLLTTDHHIFDIGYMRHQLTRLERCLILVEVAAYAPLQVLGFTHIDNCTFTIEVLIYTGLLRQALQE